MRECGYILLILVWCLEIRRWHWSFLDTIIIERISFLERSKQRKRFWYLRDGYQYFWVVLRKQFSKNLVLNKKKSPNNLNNYSIYCWRKYWEENWKKNEYNLNNEFWYCILACISIGDGDKLLFLIYEKESQISVTIGTLIITTIITTIIKKINK